jgi:hypothetical protein
MAGVGTLTVLAVLVLEDDGSRQHFSIVRQTVWRATIYTLVPECSDFATREIGAAG